MIDVIIPAYNAHSTIDRAMASILTQTARDRIRVTIADDQSDHGYEETVRRFAGMLQIQEIRLPKNGGPGVARQAGIDATYGKYLTFLDADDVFLTASAIKNITQPMEEDPNIYMVSSHFFEELPGGSFLSHEYDTTWMFGKAYRREYLDKHRVRFNKTRANEDLGFNTKVRSFAGPEDIIYFLYEHTYIWQHKADSITRDNNGRYAHTTGYVGFIENKAEALSHPKANPEFVQDDGLKTIIAMYFMYSDMMAYAPKEKENAEASLRAFWDLIGRTIFQQAYSQKIAEVHDEVSRRWGRPRTIPPITFYDFIARQDQPTKK